MKTGPPTSDPGPCSHDPATSEARPPDSGRDPSPTVRALAGVFKALADETRLQMLALLLDRPELCVCHFERALEISQSKASRHLRYLLNAGLLEDRREGVWMYYRLTDDMDPERRLILNTVGRCLHKGSPAELETCLERSFCAASPPQPSD
jgi:ArsR family transcriptional regulator, arsenate/arsenite/antimonite-responsive transcriptional repressor